MQARINTPANHNSGILFMAILATIMILISSLTSAATNVVDKDRLINAIIQVESGGDANAVGDNGKAVGILQIHKVMVDDCNRIAGFQKFTYEDRKDEQKSREMFTMYTDHYTPDWDPEKVSRRWNAGPKGDKKKCSEGYWGKVKKLLNM